MIALGDLHVGDVVTYRPPHLGTDDPGEAGVVTRLASKERGAFVRFRADGSQKLCPAGSLTKDAQ